MEDTHKPPHRYDAALQALNVLGIDPDARDDDGGTPMHRAAGEGYPSGEYRGSDPLVTRYSPEGYLTRGTSDDFLAGAGLECTNARP